MKKTAWLSPLIITLLAGTAPAQDDIELVESCMLPSALDGQNVRAGNKQAEAAGIVSKFNAAQGGAWKAAVDSRSGQVRVLYGGSSKQYGGSPEETAKAFLRDSSAVFGLRGDLADMRILSTDTTPERDHISLQQTYEGVPVSGAALLVHATKDGQVTMAQNNYIENVKPVNSRQISEADAVSKVMEDLKTGAAAETVFGTARAEELIVPVGDQYYFAWKVTVSAKNPFAFWVYHVDAANSAILHKENAIVSMRNGVGRVYKNNNAWLQNKLSKVALKQLFTESDGYMSGGLWGKHADVYDNEGDGFGDDPYAPNLKFLYYPYGSEKPWFDAVTAYYMLNTSWTWWNNNVIKKYGPKNINYFHTLSIPVIVNVTGMCNAYYTSELQDNYPPGFVFGDENACVEGSEDFALDEDVVMHEFTHAMMEWGHFGRQFGGVVNGYGRAMGEGNADWFACLRTKDPVMGEVVSAWTTAGYTRNLDNTRMYPADVADPFYGPEYKNEDGETVIVVPLPEEHYTGEIWGGYLYDLVQALGFSKALQYVYRGNYYFAPAGGFKKSASDFYDAINAQRLAEQDLTGKLTSTVKAWGSMSSRGLLGMIRSPYSSPCYFPTTFPTCKKDEESDEIICEPCSAGNDAEAYFVFKLSGGSSLSTQGKFLKASVCNEYPVQLGGGLQLNVKVTGSGTSPSITLYNSSKTIVAGPNSGTADGVSLSVSGKPSGVYSVMTCGAAAGSYTIQISTAN